MICASGDWLTFLQNLMSSSPVPVVVCPGLTGPRTEAAMRALEMGAVDIITKPKIGIRGFLEESAVMLEDTVRAAATAPCQTCALAVSTCPTRTPMSSRRPQLSLRPRPLRKSSS